MNVLAVVAHPDDEVLGCGGTLAKHAENGNTVQVVILVRRALEDAMDDAYRTLGLGTGHPDAILGVHDWPDQRLDTIPFKEIADTIWTRGDWPDVIYTHHPGDLNQDHALTARAVLTAFRPKHGEKPRTILACEVLSSTEWTFPPAFQPNYFVALTEGQLQKKIEAMECYESELCEWPHPRSKLGIRNLAAYRGQQVGVEAAEAFQLLRHGPA